MDEHINVDGEKKHCEKWSIDLNTPISVLVNYQIEKIIFLFSRRLYIRPFTCTRSFHSTFFFFLGPDRWDARVLQSVRQPRPWAAGLPALLQTKPVLHGGCLDLGQEHRRAFPEWPPPAGRCLLVTAAESGGFQMESLVSEHSSSATRLYRGRVPLLTTYIFAFCAATQGKTSTAMTSVTLYWH